MIRDKKLKNLVKKFFKECQINEKLSDVKVLKFSQALRELPKLQAIQATTFLLEELRTYETKTTLTVEAATPLSVAEMKKIENVFKAAYHIQHTSYQYSPSLLGGVRVKIGDILFDNSVWNKLEQVKKVIAHG